MFVQFEKFGSNMRFSNIILGMNIMLKCAFYHQNGLYKQQGFNNEKINLCFC